MMALLYVIARKPVRASLAVLTPTVFKLLNRVTLAMKLVSLVRMTVEFLRTPAPKPTPSVLIRKAK